MAEPRQEEAERNHKLAAGARQAIYFRDGGGGEMIDVRWETRERQMVISRQEEYVGVGLYA